MRKHILSAIQAHAAEQYPREACGLVLAVGRRHEYVPCTNTATDPGEEFRIAPEEYAAAEDRGRIIGVVHSHPDATSRPSTADTAQCEASGLAWHILSWPEGDLRTIVPTGEMQPLIGRPFVHGTWDCWGLIRDWYQLERGITLPDFERADGWWERGDDLYMRHHQEAGFEQVTDGTLQVGDLILMQIQSKQVNHGAIYLGDGLLLHHLHGRLSSRDVWGGYWAERARLVVRYRGK